MCIQNIFFIDLDLKTVHSFIARDIITLFMSLFIARVYPILKVSWNLRNGGNTYIHKAKSNLGQFVYAFYPTLIQAHVQLPVKSTLWISPNYVYFSASQLCYMPHILPHNVR